jgi:replication-associated recombination protein RarA
MNTRGLFANDSSLPPTDPSSRSFCEKYRPRKIADFAGLVRAKAILQKFAAHPYRSAWIFVGPTGVGKTSMALALASEISAELHHLYPTCTPDDIERVWEQCQGFPRSGYKKHLILVDDVDRVSKAALTTLIAKLDTQRTAPDTIWVLTCPETKKLGRRFLSFCLEVKFPSYGIAKEAIALLEQVWNDNGGQTDASKPNFARIVKESNNDLRRALMTLEMKMMSSAAAPLP